MGIRSFLSGLFGSGPSINPATGLPMLGAVNTEGNPYGTDLHRHDDPIGMSAGASGIGDDHHHHDGLDDHWSSPGSPTGNDWSSSSWPGVSSPWPDHSSGASSSIGGGYDPSRGW